MPRRSTAKAPPQPQAAILHDVQATHYPGWSYQEHFGGFLIKPTSPADAARIHIHIQGRALTVSFGPSKADNKLAAILKIYKRSKPPEYVASPLFHRFILPEIANLKTTKAVWCGDTLSIRFVYNDVERPAVRFPMVDPDNAPHSTVIAIPIDFGKPVAPIIPARKTRTSEGPMLDKAKSFTHDGVRYFPLSLAAPVVQAPASTLLDWIKKKTKFDGRPLQTYHFAPANQYLISAESIERAANRFVTVPAEEPARTVTLGETRDQSGYIGLTDAAEILGIGHHTIWRWATKGTAPTDEPLDVIKCPASDQLYIRQSDVTALKKLIPRGGLRAGRRPLPVLQPN